METGYLLAKAILKLPLRSWFSWHIEGSRHIPREGAALMAFNHIAYLDPLAAAYAVDEAGRRPRFLGKAELFEDRRIGWLLRSAGQIPVHRGTPKAPMALDQAEDALDAGEIVVVFPEGTITDDPDLRPMKAHTGIARLALHTGTPVLPCALWGTANVWGKGVERHWWPPRQPLCVGIGPPITFSGDPDSRDDWRRVGAEIMDAISVRVAELRTLVPDLRRHREAA